MNPDPEPVSIWSSIHDGSRRRRAVAVYGTFLMSPGYRGPLFEITRANDRRAFNIFAADDGKPQISALQDFLANTTGFFSTLYGQCGTGRHATQTGGLGNCPSFDFNYITRGVPEALFHTQYRGYLLKQRVFRIASWDAQTLEIEAGIPWYVLVGCAVSGDNVQPGTVISAVDYAASTIILDRVPAGPPSRLQITPPAVWLDIPPAVEVPWISHSVMMAVRHCEIQGCKTPILLGQAASVAKNTLLPFQSLFKAFYRGSSLRFVGGNNGTLQNSQGPLNFTDDAVLGYSSGGRHGKIINWLFCGESRTNPEYGDPRIEVKLSGGSIGYSPQVGGAQPIWGAPWAFTVQPSGALRCLQCICCRFNNISAMPWGSTGEHGRPVLSVLAHPRPLETVS